MLAIISSFADSVFASLPHSVFADILSGDHEHGVIASMCDSVVVEG